MVLTNFVAFLFYIIALVDAIFRTKKFQKWLSGGYNNNYYDSAINYSKLKNA